LSTKWGSGPSMPGNLKLDEKGGTKKENDQRTLERVATWGEKHQKTYILRRGGRGHWTKGARPWK